MAMSPNPSFQRTPTCAGFGPLNSDRQVVSVPQGTEAINGAYQLSNDSPNASGNRSVAD